MAKLEVLLSQVIKECGGGPEVDGKFDDSEGVSSSLVDGKLVDSTLTFGALRGVCKALANAKGGV